MIFRQFYFLIIVFFSVRVFSQISTTSDTSSMDTIFFLNGEVRAIKVVDTVAHLIRFLPEKRKKKPHVLDVEKDRVFSVKFSNGQERIIYFHDSAIGNVFTVLEAKMFMLGEREADLHYRNKWPFVIGFAMGAVSPVSIPNAVALSPILPAVTPLHTKLPTIKINSDKIQNKNYLQYDTYLMGYEKTARKRNFMNSVLGAGIGLAVGFGTWAVSDETWRSIGIDKTPDASDTPLQKFSKKSFIYGIWLGEVGCSIGISALCSHKKRAKK